jgi:hypothetical protein
LPPFLLELTANLVPLPLEHLRIDHDQNSPLCCVKSLAERTYPSQADG